MVLFINKNIIQLLWHLSLIVNWVTTVHVCTNVVSHFVICTCISTTVISKPDDVTECEGKKAVFTCVLNSSIRSDDVQWYRFIKDNSTTVMVDPNGENIYFVTTNMTKTISSLTITSVIKSYTGYFWVGTPSLNVCNASLIVLTSM